MRLSTQEFVICLLLFPFPHHTQLCLPIHLNLQFASSLWIMLCAQSWVVWGAGTKLQLELRLYAGGIRFGATWLSAGEGEGVLQCEQREAKQCRKLGVGPEGFGYFGSVACIFLMWEERDSHGLVHMKCCNNRTLSCWWTKCFFKKQQVKNSLLSNTKWPCCKHVHNWSLNQSNWCNYFTI